jgi:hypothetical protein
LPYNILQQEFVVAGAQLVQGRDLIAFLKGADGQERSETKVIRGLLETRSKVQTEHPWLYSPFESVLASRLA